MHALLLVVVGAVIALGSVAESCKEAFAKVQVRTKKNGFLSFSNHGSNDNTYLDFLATEEASLGEETKRMFLDSGGDTDNGDIKRRTGPEWMTEEEIRKISLVIPTRRGTGYMFSAAEDAWDPDWVKLSYFKCTEGRESLRVRREYKCFGTAAPHYTIRTWIPDGATMFVRNPNLKTCICEHVFTFAPDSQHL